MKERLYIDTLLEQVCNDEVTIRPGQGLTVHNRAGRQGLWRRVKAARAAAQVAKARTATGDALVAEILESWEQCGHLPMTFDGRTVTVKCKDGDAFTWAAGPEVWEKVREGAQQ